MNTLSLSMLLFGALTTTALAEPIVSTPAGPDAPTVSAGARVTTAATDRRGPVALSDVQMDAISAGVTIGLGGPQGAASPALLGLQNAAAAILALHPEFEVGFGVRCFPTACPD